MDKMYKKYQREGDGVSSKWTRVINIPSNVKNFFEYIPPFDRILTTYGLNKRK